MLWLLIFYFFYVWHFDNIFFSSLKSSYLIAVCMKLVCCLTFPSSFTTSILRLRLQWHWDSGLPRPWWFLWGPHPGLQLPPLLPLLLLPQRLYLFRRCRWGCHLSIMRCLVHQQLIQHCCPLGACMYSRHLIILCPLFCSLKLKVANLQKCIAPFPPATLSKGCPQHKITIYVFSCLLLVLPIVPRSCHVCLSFALLLCLHNYGLFPYQSCSPNLTVAYFVHHYYHHHWFFTPLWRVLTRDDYGRIAPKILVHTFSTVSAKKELCTIPTVSDRSTNLVCSISGKTSKYHFSGYILLIFDDSTLYFDDCS